MLTFLYLIIGLLLVVGVLGVILHRRGANMQDDFRTYEGRTWDDVGPGDGGF